MSNIDQGTPCRTWQIDPATARSAAFIGDGNADCASSEMKQATMQHRHGFKSDISLDLRLADEAERLRKQAERAMPGFERERLIRRARQAETAAHVNEWLRSGGLKSPQ